MKSVLQRVIEQERDGQSFESVLRDLAEKAKTKRAPITWLAGQLQVSLPTCRKWLSEAGLLETLKAKVSDAQPLQS